MVSRYIFSKVNLCMCMPGIQTFTFYRSTKLDQYFLFLKINYNPKKFHHLNIGQTSARDLIACYSDWYCACSRQATLKSDTSFLSPVTIHSFKKNQQNLPSPSPHHLKPKPNTTKISICYKTCPKPVSLSQRPNRLTLVIHTIG